jgi:hypothetical protein
MSRPLLSDLSPKFQAQAVAQLHAAPRPRTVKIEPADSVPVKKRLRQNCAGLNKTEAAFEVQLKADAKALEIDVLPSQSITLRLGNGVRYTPDFITVEHEPLDDAAGCAQTLRAYEVKGFMRDDAAVKLKVAASLYPWIKFHLVTKAKGKFEMQEILP